MAGRQSNLAHLTLLYRNGYRQIQVHRQSGRLVRFPHIPIWQVQYATAVAVTPNVITFLSSISSKPTPAPLVSGRTTCMSPTHPGLPREEYEISPRGPRSTACLNMVSLSCVQFPPRSSTPFGQTRAASPWVWRRHKRRLESRRPC